MFYEWDEAKNEANKAKHGVSFAMCEEFNWLSAVIIPDDRNDYGEERLIALGYIGRRIHVLIYTQRMQTRRIISLRKANKREERFYAKEA